MHTATTYVTFYDKIFLNLLRFYLLEHSYDRKLTTYVIKMSSSLQMNKSSFFVIVYCKVLLGLHCYSGNSDINRPAFVRAWVEWKKHKKYIGHFVFAHKCYFAQKLVPSHIQALRRSLETKRRSRIGRLGKTCGCRCSSIRVRLVWIIWRKSWRRRNLERYCLWLQVVKRTSDIWLRIFTSDVSVKRNLWWSKLQNNNF